MVEATSEVVDSKTRPAEVSVTVVPNHGHANRSTVPTPVSARGSTTTPASSHGLHGNDTGVTLKITSGAEHVRIVPRILVESSSTKGTKRKRESLADGRHEPIKLAPNPFNMTSRNFPKRRNFTKNANGVNRTRASTQSHTRALEQVRAALQPSLNAEIERVLQSYQEMFRMAAYNISDNTQEPITEEHVNHILRRSLEEAKSLFRVESKDGDSNVTKVKQERVAAPIKQVIIKKKRERNEDHRESKPKDDYPYPPWNESRITEDIEFIMGVKANKILGYASARGRLYMRHPDLFKYMGDQDDKQWLYENSQMPITGGKAFLMLADDIRGLATAHPDYKDNLGIKAEDIKGFKVPPQMLEKIRASMRRGAIVRAVANKPVEKKEDSKLL